MYCYLKDDQLWFHKGQKEVILVWKYILNMLLESVFLFPFVSTPPPLGNWERRCPARNSTSRLLCHMSKLQMMVHDKKCCYGSLPEVNLLVLHVFFLLWENWHGVLVEKGHLCSYRQWGCGSNGTEGLGSWWPWTQPNCPSGQPSSSNFMREQYIFLLIKSLLLDFCSYDQTNTLTNHTVRKYVGVEMSLTCMRQSRDCSEWGRG